MAWEKRRQRNECGAKNGAEESGAIRMRPRHGGGEALAQRPASRFAAGRGKRERPREGEKVGTIVRGK